jgi:hypothetical protein
MSGHLSITAEDVINFLVQVNHHHSPWTPQAVGDQCRIWELL